MGEPNQAQQAIDAAAPGAANLDGLRVLVKQAKAGELYLDPDVAKTCASACNDLLDLLGKVRDRMRSADHLIALGDFESGKTLSQTLKDMVSGAEGFQQRLDEHMTAVKLIHDLVGAQVAKLVTTDDDLRVSVANAGK